VPRNRGPGGPTRARIWQELRDPKRATRQAQRTCRGNGLALRRAAGEWAIDRTDLLGRQRLPADADRQPRHGLPANADRRPPTSLASPVATAGRQTVT